MNKKTIHLFGSYSGYNKGDLAILYSIIKGIFEVEKNINFIVPSKHPNKIKNYIPFSNVKIYKTITSYLGMRTFNMIKRSDFLFFGGGGLFFDKKILNPFYNHVINLFLISLINKIFYKKKIYIFSVGASHLNSKFSLFLTKFILNEAFSITVRDEYTKNVFSKLTKKNIDIFYDPVFSLEPREIKMGEYKKNILLIINKACLNDRAKNSVLDFIEQKKNDNIFLIQNCDDQGVVRILLKDIKNRSNINYLNENNLNPEELSFFYGSFPIVISFPMHGSILTYLNNDIKLITIKYDNKVDNLNKIINNKNYIELNCFKDINKILNNYKAIPKEKKQAIINNVNNHFWVIKKILNDF